MERDDLRPLHPLVNEKNDLQRGGGRNFCSYNWRKERGFSLTYACWQELTSPFLVAAERSDIYC